MKLLLLLGTLSQQSANNATTSELAINNYIAAYYLKNFSYLGQTGAGQWASMFGLLNVVTR